VLCMSAWQLLALDGVTPNIPEENVAYFVHLATQQKHSHPQEQSDLAVAAS